VKSGYPKTRNFRHVWRKFHILSRVQVFVVSCVCAAVIAVPFAIASISHDETALFRDLFWPHQFNPLINYGAIFMSVLPLLLGYYQLGRLGALLSLAVSVVAFCVMALCAFCSFGGHAPLFGTIAYVSARAEKSVCSLEPRRCSQVAPSCTILRFTSTMRSQDHSRPRSNERNGDISTVTACSRKKTCATFSKKYECGRVVDALLTVDWRHHKSSDPQCGLSRHRLPATQRSVIALK